ncbi:DUF2889 domain-containing protein [Geobacter sp. SVR]|uniref:DUF2889 domain-containing protein n=1 Tax=Geobacter sp. SVR TaxID=2495594 RepID=UPI00143EFB9A|nr:DUF2889 domain-containing protein [Geobacter sp. SVR]BCS52247.1 hypothetical protein GSVR_05550 [Geobacter sp. SVR]GCF85092.1 hypothetical protein GSbR_16920 [Geobacter sp. SVR]
MTNLMDGFQRDISYRIGRHGDGRLLLSATMRDRYHDIVLEVLVLEDTLVIDGITAEFRRCPTGECRFATLRLQQLAGTTIGKGLNRRIMEALGGESGCGNLRNLLLGLLPLAMNLKAAEGFEDEEAMMDNIREQLRGTCAGYPRRSDGGAERA